jgi:hypothetical protein
MRQLSMHDLKCGNIVNYDTKDEEKGVEYATIDWNHLRMITGNQEAFNSIYCPALISEFWMLEFGFRAANGHEFSKWIDEYENTSLVVHVDDDKCFFVGICINQKLRWTTGKIKYLHQLQNLYHSITGIMLTSKLDFQ